MILTEYSLQGVDLGPEEHAQQKINEYRAATVGAAMLEPSVGSVQYGTLMGNGVGNQWAIVFTETNFKVTVLFDKKRSETAGRVLGT
jgi:hypothetical protein